MSEAPTRPGWVSERLRDEFPQLGLTLLELEVERPLARSPKGVRERLALMADRFHGADAVVMRQRPIPHAYRVFFRHIGLDPDVTRTPVEAAAVDRLLRGGLPSRGLLEDALTIAVLETGVPVWGVDADAVVGTPGLRLSGESERLGEGERAMVLPSGRIVVGDERGPLGLLFGEMAPDRMVTKETRRVLLFAVRVDGVAPIHVDEALWTCEETFAS
jgi:DNA/RNA-binding domain of Phe-tRNA-synthetase-like protein